MFIARKFLPRRSVPSPRFHVSSEVVDADPDGFHKPPTAYQTGMVIQHLNKVLLEFELSSRESHISYENRSHETICLLNKTLHHWPALSHTARFALFTSRWYSLFLFDSACSYGRRPPTVSTTTMTTVAQQRTETTHSLGLGPHHSRSA